MASIVDSTFSQPAPDAGAGINAAVQGDQQGLAEGLALAHGQQQSQLLGQQVQNMKQDFDNKTNDAIMSTYRQILNTDDPVARKLGTQNLNNLYAKYKGGEMAPDVAEGIQKSDQARQSLNMLLSQHDALTDPASIQKAKDLIVSLGQAGSYTEAAQQLGPTASEMAKLKQTEMNNNAEKDTAAIKGKFEVEAAGARAGSVKNIQGLQDSFSKSIDPAKAQPNTTFGKAAQINFQAARLSALKEQYPDLNFPPQQMEEAGIGVATMLMNGTRVPQGIIEKIVPKSSSGDIASVAQWLKNEPNGAGQKEFVKSMYSTIGREKDKADAAILKEQTAAVNSHSAFKNAYPKEFEDVRSAYMGKPVSGVAQPADTVTAPGTNITTQQQINQLVDIPLTLSNQISAAAKSNDIATLNKSLQSKGYKPLSPADYLNYKNQAVKQGGQ